MLPAEFLLKQGIYIQSCAHVELALWEIVQIADGQDPDDDFDRRHYLKIKKVTVKLIDAVRSAIGKIPPPLAIRLSAVVERVDVGRENRNTAAHGAWYLTPKGKLEVEHYFQRPSQSGPVWQFVDQTFSMRQIDLAVEDVDHLLRETVYIRDTLKAVLRNRRTRSRTGY